VEYKQFPKSSVLIFKYNDSNLGLKSVYYSLFCFFLRKINVNIGNTQTTTNNIIERTDEMISPLLSNYKSWIPIWVDIAISKYDVKHDLNIELKKIF
jgi:hypothetical protein